MKSFGRGDQERGCWPAVRNFDREAAQGSRLLTVSAAFAPNGLNAMPVARQAWK
jgi:hypothetical protein